MAANLEKWAAAANVFRDYATDVVKKKQGQQDQSTASGAPKVGEIRKGYRFKGGNPADKNSWEKVQ